MYFKKVNLAPTFVVDSSLHGTATPTRTKSPEHMVVSGKQKTVSTL